MIHVKPTDNQTVDELDLAAPDESDQTERKERYRHFVDEYVRAPFAILWSDWRSKVGMLIVLGYVLMGTVAVRFVEEPYSNQGERYLQPMETLQYPLGTDGTGQDLFGLVVHATPDMLIMILAGSVFSTIIATIVGTLSGYKGGPIDRALMVVTDVMMTIPGLPLIIVLAAIFEPRHPAIVGLILSVNVWAGLARSLRSQVLTLRDQSYVEASRIMGVSTRSILTKDVIPNLMPYILINFVNSARNVIFNSVALYFLGVLPYTNLNWGVVLEQGYNSPALHSLELMHWILVPLVTIVFLSFGLILLSQGFDRVFNPRIRAKHTKSAPDDETTGSGDDGSNVTTTLGR